MVCGSSNFLYSWHRPFDEGSGPRGGSVPCGECCCCIMHGGNVITNASNRCVNLQTLAMENHLIKFIDSPRISGNCFLDAPPRGLPLSNRFAECERMSPGDLKTIEWWFADLRLEKNQLRIRLPEKIFLNMILSTKINSSTISYAAFPVNYCAKYCCGRTEKIFRLLLPIYSNLLLPI